MAESVLVQPESSGLSTFSAARWNVKVLIDGTYGEGDEVWAWVNGLNKFEPTQDPTNQDDTDIFSRSFKSSLVTATSEDVSMEGMVKGRKSAGIVVVDPGLAFIRSKRHLVGEDNIITLMYWRRDTLQETAIVQTFSVAWKDVGGGIEDLQKFTADCKGRGAPLVVPAPVETRMILTVPEAVTEMVITLNGEDATVDCDPNPTAATIRTALELLAGVLPGDVSVSGPTGGPFSLQIKVPVTELEVAGTGGTPTLTDPA